MQTHGHIRIDGETVLVLIRSTKYGVQLKRRTSGSFGAYLQAETEYLAERPLLARDLLSGKVVYL